MVELAAPPDRSRELERETLQGERRVGVGVPELPADVVGKHRRPRVPEATRASGLSIGLNHHDPSAVRPEQILVPLLRRHLDHGPVGCLLFGPNESFVDTAVYHHGEAGVRVTVPCEAMIGREDDLGDLGVVEALPARQDGPRLDPRGIHQTTS
jgi:hypothetical protein